MQHILMLMFSSVLLLLQVLQVTSGDDIVGRWEAKGTTRGGLGSTLQFNRNGTFNFSFGPLLGGTYKLDGNKLIITTFQSPPEKPTTEVYEIKIEGDTLFEKTKDGVEIKMVRLNSGAPGNSSIVGKWATKTPILEFRLDGSFDIDSSTNSSVSGTYKLERNHLYMTTTLRGAKGSVTQAYEIEIDGDTLIWRRDDTPNTVMRRISPRTTEGTAITGRWSIIDIDGTDNLSIGEYKANGEWTFRLPIMVRKGRYSIKGDLLTTIFDDREIKISRFRFERGLMVLKSPPKSGPEDRFKRIE